MKINPVTIMALILSVVVLASCQSSTPTPPPAPVEPQGDAVAGQKSYSSTCVACHGGDAKGMPGLGKDLTISEFVKNQTDSQLVDFIKVGRSAGDPANTVGVDMPPKGGNPALTDQDLLNIVAYLRTLQQ